MMDANTVQTNLDNIRKNLDASPLLRTLRNPVKMITPIIMRRLSSKKEVVLDLVSGGKFHGILPEAVTTMVWRHGYFDYKTSKNILSHLPENGVFIDIGAHFGYFSSLAANVLGKGGTVVSIEAMPTTFKYLQKNLKENANGANVHAINKAAYNKETTLTFSDYGVVFSSLNSAFGIRNNKIDQTKVVDVNVSTVLVDNVINELSLKRIDVIKIDAESSEYYVLEGMKNILKKFSPVLIIELGDDGIEGDEKGSKAVVNLLKSFNYEAYELQGDTLVNVSDRDKYHYCNLVFKKSK